MKVLKKIQCTLLLVIIISIIFGCNASTNQVSIETTANTILQNESTENVQSDLTIADLSIYKDEEFGSIYVDKSIEDFDALGFEYGDSVDVIFSNGYELKDIPYYDGFYAKTGEPILVSYHGYGDVVICICNGEGLWDVAKVDKNDKVKISRREKAKFKNVQKLFSLKYSNNRDDYKSDEIFANFRNVKVGNLKENILYRGASPIDNKNMRAKYANDLIEKANVKYDIDLSDDENKLKKHFSQDDFNSEYFKKLYDDNKVSILSLDMNYKSKSFAEKVVKALTDMSKNDGPYYVHCVEGKDRTGFLCMVIEGLLGASYEEIVNDYMITYENYYGVNKIDDKEKYNAIKENYIDDMLRFIADNDPYTGEGTIELEYLDWVNVIGRYLINNGMSEEDINNLYDKIGSENYSDPD